MQMQAPPPWLEPPPRSRLCASAEASLGRSAPEHGALGCRGRHFREAGAGAPARRRQRPTCWPRLWPGLVRARAGTHGCRGRTALRPLAARGRGSISPAPAAGADGAGSRPRGCVGCLPPRSRCCGYPRRRPRLAAKATASHHGRGSPSCRRARARVGGTASALVRVAMADPRRTTTSATRSSSRKQTTNAKRNGSFHTFLLFPVVLEAEASNLLQRQELPSILPTNSNFFSVTVYAMAFSRSMESNWLITCSNAMVTRLRDSAK